jgi:transcriptional regulator with XRE-family HTH domain
MFERFKELREEREITKEQLSEDIDVCIDIINSIENGFNAPIEVLRKYAVYFGVTADYILELTDEEDLYSDGNRK